MIDMRDLLGKLLQSNPAGSTDSRVNHALGPQGLGAGDSPLGGMLGGLFGPGGSLAGMREKAEGLFGSGGSLGGVGQQAGGLFETARQRVEGGDPRAIGGFGALAGLVLGGKGGAVGAGAMALLGSLAYAALKKSQGAAATGATELTPAELEKNAPLGMREPKTPQEEEDLQKIALLVIQAMVTAAKADGQIDAAEMSRIMGRLKEAGADEEAQAFMISEMQKPFDPDALISEVKALGRPEVAVEVYSASLLAIEVDTSAEREYLARLASGLGLSAEAVGKVHEALGVPQP
jgi:uncharacterized membrane protein YebE (DUF533 family)